MSDWADDLAKEKQDLINQAALDKQVQVEYLALLFRRVENQGRIAALEDLENVSRGWKFRWPFQKSNKRCVKAD